MDKKQAKRVIELLEYIALNVQIVAKVAQAAAAQFQIKSLINPFEPKVPEGLEKLLQKQ
jgi:hypothetical protein